MCYPVSVYSLKGVSLMYELIKVTETCYYIQCPAKIGLIRTGQDHVCLIDSGNDKDAGKKIKRILDEHGWKLDAIYNTHSHADHIGGNLYLQKQTGCSAYAKGIERCLTENPVLEPAFLYGANPPAELRHKFFMAQKSKALELTEECLPDALKMFPLPGHSWDMVGFGTSDNIVFLADCLASRETLEKYQVTYIIDIQAYLDTLNACLDMEAELFIPSHADPAKDISPLVRFNIDKVHEIADAILGFCREPVSFEHILQKLFDHYSLRMTFEQHELVGCTTRSYLTWLKEQGQLQAIIDQNMLLWKS